MRAKSTLVSPPIGFPVKRPPSRVLFWLSRQPNHGGVGRWSLVPGLTARSAFNRPADAEVAPR